MSTTSLQKALRYLEEGNWQAAHPLVQKDESNGGCWAHGLVHWLEGDMINARYWYRRAHRALPLDGEATSEIAALKASLDTRQKSPPRAEAATDPVPAAKGAVRTAALSRKASRA